MGFKSKEEFDAWAEKYLEGYFETFKKMTKKDNDYFKSLGINNQKSYYVVGDRDKLELFITYYLMLKCQRFSTYMVSEFASEIYMHNDIIDCEVLILYNHGHKTYTGGGESAIWNTVLDRASSRNRVKEKKVRFKTIVLSERDIPYIRNSGEFENLDLNNLVDPTTFKTIGVDEVANSAKYRDNKNNAEGKEGQTKLKPEDIRKDEG